MSGVLGMTSVLISLFTFLIIDWLKTLFKILTSIQILTPAIRMASPEIVWRKTMDVPKQVIARRRGNIL
jgi:hypothetical protein